MIIVTEPKVIYECMARSLITKDTIIYNLNANTANFTPIYLMPPREMLSSPEFDNEYINLLLTNDNYFMQLMKIVINLQHGFDIYILRYNEDFVFNPITETLMKLIQQRYGYNYQEIFCADDLDVYDSSSFSAFGIMQFDEDFKRYESIMVRTNPYLYINEVIDDSGATHV